MIAEQVNPKKAKSIYFIIRDGAQNRKAEKC